MAEKTERRMAASCLEKSSSSPACFSVSHETIRTTELTREQAETSLMNGNNQAQWLVATDTLNDKIVLNAAGEYGAAPPSGFYSNGHGNSFFKVYRSVSMSYSSPDAFGDGVYWLHAGDTEGYKLGDAMHVIYNDGVNHFEWDTAISVSPNQVSLSNAVLKSNSAVPSAVWYDTNHGANYFWIYKYFANSNYIDVIKH